MTFTVTNWASTPLVAELQLLNGVPAPISTYGSVAVTSNSINYFPPSTLPTTLQAIRLVVREQTGPRTGTAILTLKANSSPTYFHGIVSSGTFIPYPTFYPSGSNGAGHFNFHFSDGNGFTDIGSTQHIFSTGPGNACHVKYEPALDLMYLAADGSGWNVGQLGATGTLETSKCEVDLALSTVTHARPENTIQYDHLFFGLRVKEFKQPAFAGLTLKAYVDHSSNPTGLLIPAGPDFTVPGDPSAPVVTDLPTIVRGNAAVISWTTDDLSDSQVDYGISSALGTAVVDPKMTQNHKVVLRGLNPNQRYYYRLRSKNSSDKTGQSGVSEFVSGAAATIVPGAKSTGQGADGTQDLNYTVGGEGAASAMVLNPAQSTWAPGRVHSNWVANGASKWIGPKNASGQAMDACGNYWYETRFSLGGRAANSALLSGRFASDNGAGIYLNGESIASNSAERAFETFQDFSYAGSGFLPGENTLRFEVENPCGFGNSPTGLNAEILVTAIEVPTTVSNLVLDVGSLTGGSPLTGRVVLSGPAPAGGLTVQINTNRPELIAPVIVVVAANAAEKTFSIPTNAVGTATLVGVTAIHGSTFDTKNVTVNPATGGAEFFTLLPAGEAFSNYSGWVGQRIKIGATSIVLTQLGRKRLPGNSQAHEMRVFAAGDSNTPVNANTPVASATVNFGATPVEQFAYAPLSSGPVQLQAGQSYFVVSAETSGGDAWRGTLWGSPENYCSDERGELGGRSVSRQWGADHLRGARGL